LEWLRTPAFQTTSAADGSYALSVDRDDAVIFDLDGRQVVWMHAEAPRRIDVAIDRSKPKGVIALFDGDFMTGDPCEDARSCPSVATQHAPAVDWWTRPRPCPDGAQLRFQIAGDMATAPGVTVSCERDGVNHGAITTMIRPPEGYSWRVSRGWYDHGKRCGTWDEPPPLPPPPPPQPGEPLGVEP
jgi:hypothetical protein